MLPHVATETLYKEARTRDCAAGLRALGEFTHGRPCYAAHGAFAVIGENDRSVPLFNGFGTIADLGPAPEQDKAIAALGLALVRTTAAPTPIGRRAQVGVLIWRAGLLAKILDTAFAHLSSRESGGQKTLQHQLVKATFTECFTASERIRSEMPFYLDEDRTLDFASQNNEIGRLTTTAAKLMGGHGFLLGSLNSLEALSLVVSNLVAEKTSAKRKLVAA